MGKYEKEKPPSRIWENIVRFVTLLAAVMQIIDTILKWLDG